MPYWGRSAETIGEDPYLTSQMAAAKVMGLQSQHVIATTKHFADNNQETYRLGVNPDDNTVPCELVSPLQGITAPAGSAVKVTYAPAGP